MLNGEQPIDLLFCDVVLGGIDGRRLAELGRQMRPGLKVLMTTGYPDQLRGQPAGVPIIAKPYQQADLTAKLAELFDS
jgi:DNA-binding LytR/AlgR family response regulator